MFKFITSTGETAYVPTADEKEIIRIALEQFKSHLPEKEGVLNG